MSAQQMALFPPRSNENPLLSPTLLLGIKLGFSIIGSLPFSVYRGLFFLPFLASSPAGILSGNTVRCSRLTVIPSSALLNRRREGGLHQALLGQRTFQLLN